MGKAPPTSADGQQWAPHQCVLIPSCGTAAAQALTQMWITTFPRASPAFRQRIASAAWWNGYVRPADARGDLTDLDELGEPFEVARAMPGDGAWGGVTQKG